MHGVHWLVSVNQLSPWPLSPEGVVKAIETHWSQFVQRQRFKAYMYSAPNYTPFAHLAQTPSMRFEQINNTVLTGIGVSLCPACFAMSGMFRYVRHVSLCPACFAMSRHVSLSGMFHYVRHVSLSGVFRCPAWFPVRYVSLCPAKATVNENYWTGPCVKDCPSPGAG